MRAIAIMGFILFGGLTYLFVLMGIHDYKKAKEVDALPYPPWSGYMVSVMTLYVSILFLIYALGLWDAFIEWGHSLKGDELFIGKPY